MRYASLCDGIGAVHCAWQPLGWECAWTSEIDRFPIAVVDLRWGFRNLGDMTEITGDMIDEHGRLDLLVGGTPCQSFSVAGLRGGLDDARGNLALRFMQLCAAARPRWVVWENVPGVLSVDGGRAFGSILGALEELRYGWAYRTLDAQWFGVAQRRRRVFVVGCLGDWRRAAALLFEQQSVRGDPATREAPREAAASIAGRGAAGASWPAEVSCCINSSFGNKIGLDGQHIDGGGSMFVPGRGAAVASWWDGGQLSNTIDAKADCHRMPDKGRLNAVLEPVAHTSDGVVADPITTTEGKTWENAGNNGRLRNCVQEPMAVRRLTPRECERLQGFPDDYTLIPWRKKPAEDCPDGPRYRALGNSMAVPVMRWIGERIEAVDRIPNTGEPDAGQDR